MYDVWQYGEHVSTRDVRDVTAGAGRDDVTRCHGDVEWLPRGDARGW